MCVDLKEEKHGMRLMMLPSWPTTANASASHVLPIVPVPHYLPQKNLLKEGREKFKKKIKISEVMIQLKVANQNTLV